MKRIQLALRILAIFAALPLWAYGLEPGELLHAKRIPGKWECIIFEDGRVESVRIPYHRGTLHRKFFLSAKDLKDLKGLMESENLAELPEKCGKEDGLAGDRVWMEFRIGNKISAVEATLNENPERDPSLKRFVKVWDRVNYLWLELGPKTEVPSVFPRDLSKSKYPSEE